MSALAERRPCRGTAERMATPWAGPKKLETTLMAARIGVEVPDLRAGEEEQKTEGGADAVARDHGRLEGPAVDEDSGQNAEDGDGKHVGDLDAGDLLGGRVELEGEDGDDGEEREEVSEDGDGLGVPEAAHHGDAHDLAHGERRGQSPGRWVASGSTRLGPGWGRLCSWAVSLWYSTGGEIRHSICFRK